MEAKTDAHTSKPAEGLSTSSQKRSNYLTWDQYFMSMAILSGQRSKDPNTQVGACIVSPDHKIMATGYNGMPNGCHDDDMPWGRDSDNVLETKRLYVCHAEMNAVLNKCQADLKGSRIYVSLFPCIECAKFIVQAGIGEVIYLSDKYKHKEKYKASRYLLDIAGVKMRQFEETAQKVVINFEALTLSDDEEENS